MAVHQVTRDELVQFIWSNRHGKLDIYIVDSFNGEHVGPRDWRWGSDRACHHAKIINFGYERVLLITGPHTNNRLGSFVWRFSAPEAEFKNAFKWFKENIESYFKYCCINEETNIYYKERK